MASTSAVPQQSLDKFTAELLVTEILGFSPHLLLDDYTNVSHETVRLITESVEVGVRHWIDQQYLDQDAPLTDKQKKRRDAYLVELENGVIALQTLIDSHSDLAFDSFETWAWRNIFHVPPELVMVAPHHKGLDLTISQKEDEEVRAELMRLKNQLEAMNRCEELLSDAVTASARRKARMEKHLGDMEFLESTGQLHSLASTLVPLFGQLKTLPRPHELPAATQSRPKTQSSSNMNNPPASGTTGSAKQPRVWEGSHREFLTWGVSKATRDVTNAESELKRNNLRATRELPNGPADLLSHIRAETQNDGDIFQVREGGDVVMNET